MKHASLSGFALAFVFAFACRSDPQRAAASTPAPTPAQPAPRTWTAAFQREAVLVADEILIEGPQDLIDHVVLRQDPEVTLYSTKTITEGLLQELAARPQTGMEVRGQLDAWSLAAFKRIRVLQRPGEVPVTVRARGNAYWAAAGGGGERRAEELAFEGARGQPVR
jgi:hypothetical protein